MSTVARVFRYDITIHQGMDEYFPMRVRDSAGQVPDLTGWTSHHRVYGAPATLASLHDQPPVPVSPTVMLGLFDGGAFGPYNVLPAFSAHATGALVPWGSGIHILDLIDPYGHVQYRIRGTAELEEGNRNG